MSTSNDPLWRVMQSAYDLSDPPVGGEWTDGCGFAAEIRALANWIEAQQLKTYGVVIPDVAGVLVQLRVEADRAESGE